MLLATRSALLGAVLAGAVTATAHAQNQTNAQTTSMQDVVQTLAPQTNRQITTADIKAWNSMRQTALSSDGRWFAYLAGPPEGDVKTKASGSAVRCAS